MPALFSFPVRIDKYLADSGFGNRSESKKLIRCGKVEINNRIVLQESIKVQIDDSVTVNGEPVTTYRHHYWMLHKPAGVICSNSDFRHQTIMDMIDHPLKQHMQIAGRLDKDVTGLVLLSTDGQFTHRIISPKFHLPRTYRAELEEKLISGQCDRLLEGIYFADIGTVSFSQIVHLSGHLYEIVIHSGQYHIVKRLFQAAGARLLHLHRIAVGEIFLPEDLPVNELREISSSIVQDILN